MSDRKTELEILLDKINRELTAINEIAYELQYTSEDRTKLGKSLVLSTIRISSGISRFEILNRNTW